MGSSSPNRGENIKIFELPPPSFSVFVVSFLSCSSYLTNWEQVLIKAAVRAIKNASNTLQAINPFPSAISKSLSWSIVN